MRTNPEKKRCMLKSMKKSKTVSLENLYHKIPSSSVGIEFQVKVKGLFWGGKGDGGGGAPSASFQCRTDILNTGGAFKTLC